MKSRQIDSHGFTAVVLTVSNSICPVAFEFFKNSQEMALIPNFTDGDFPLN